MKQSLRYFGMFLLWNIGISAVLLLSVRRGASTAETLLGILVSLGLAFLLLRFYLMRTGRAGESQRRSDLRLHPLVGRSLRWTLAAAPVMLIFSWSLGELYVRLVPVPPESLDPFGQLFGTAAGRLMLAMLAIAIAPILEEFFFRGLIQSTLERRWGGIAGIMAASGLFALVHFLPWVFPLHFVLGAMFGFAVYATRSILAGVLLHTVNNAVALLGQGVSSEEFHVQPTVWQAGFDLQVGYAIAGLTLSTALAVWVGRRLWDAGRDARLRHS